MGSKPNNSPKIIAAIPAFNAERYIGSIVLKTRQYVDIHSTAGPDDDNIVPFHSLASLNLLRFQ